MRSLVIAAVLVVSCGAALAESKSAKVVEGLPECKESASSPTKGWERRVVDSSFSIALPACFTRVQDQEPRYAHGGMRWSCDKATIEVVWGIWDPTSFGGGGERCTTKVNGMRVMVIRSSESDGLSVIAWYPTRGVHEPIISVHSSKAGDKDLVLSVALSGKASRRK